jgi:Tfp pilus assembly protein PilF
MLQNRWSIPLERLAVKALSVVARDQLALHMHGVALMARGQTEASVDVLRRSVQHAPDFLGARLDLAAALLQLPDKTAAAEILNASAALAERGPALLQLGLLQQKAGDGAQARASVRRALQTDDRGAWRTQAEGFLAGAVATPR